MLALLCPPALGQSLSLPMDLEKAAEHWDVARSISVVHDELLGRDVLVNDAKSATGYIGTREAFTGPGIVRVKLRLMGSDRARYAILTYGNRGVPLNPDGAYTVNAVTHPSYGPQGLRISTAYGTRKSRPYQTQAQLLGDQINQLAGDASVYFRPRFADISPLWDPPFRKEIEAAMAGAPLVENQWFELRIVHTEDVVRLYKDGFLLSERVPAGMVDGTIDLRLMYDTRVAAFSIEPLPEIKPGFEVMPLEGYLNAALADPSSGLPIDRASLPEAGKVVDFHGIPMRLPVPATVAADGGPAPDHIDVGPSLFHYRNENGGFMANVTWPDAAMYDPGRIRLTAPNRPYTRLWVLAASDGDAQSVPMFTARFYRPQAGFAHDGEGHVPTLTGEGGEARPVPVRLADGTSGNLWLVPVEFDAVALASEFREEPVLSLELTKKVHPYRSYPDPANYNYFQGGLPSGVHILAMTFEVAPVKLIASGNRAGNVYVAPEQPVWQVSLNNLTDEATTASVKVTITDPLEEVMVLERRVVLDSGAAVRTDIPVDTRTTGLHDVVTAVTLADGRTFAQKGTLVQLPMDDRNATSANTHWGLWTWGGAHGTNPNAEENYYLNLAAGAHFMNTRGAKIDKRTWDIIPAPAHVLYGPEPWASESPIDPEKYEAFKDRIGKEVARRLEENPDIPSFSIFTETAITAPLTYGVPPEYLGEGELVMDEETQKRFDAFWITAKAACEGIRQHAPKAKIALGWCEPLFTVPLLKAGFPPEMFDLIGVDSPIFERTPEMPIREVTPNRMWMLKEAMKKYGYSDKPVIHTESYYPSSHELALGHRKSADHTIRVAVLSLALESDILANCFTLHDCSGYWGSQHYGCIGLIGRRPEYNPKPAFPAFATMTRMVDLEKYDGFVPTGSPTAYCVRFKHGAELTYCLWTVRGSRPATLTFTKDAAPILTYETGRDVLLTLSDNAAEVTIGTTPIWVRVAGNKAIESVAVGAADHSDARPGFITELDSPHTLLLDDLSKAWSYDPAEQPRYDNGHWGAPRYPGPMAIASVASPERGQNVTRIDLTKPEIERPLAAWYGTFAPAEPIDIPGKAVALGIWANGHSNWGRIVYEIQDAKGEIWQSIGTTDDWNCDDVHTWSYFSHDGWRYIEFPLPNHQPGDNYREQDTVWWGYDAEGIVDLPIRLNRVFIEARTHNVYVDALQEVADRSVDLSNLIAVYESPEMATDVPVKLQRAAAGLELFTVPETQHLPNAIAELRARDEAMPAPKVNRIAPPEHFYDGTRLELAIEPVEGATEYRVYISANEDGTGAKVQVKGADPTLLVTRLRPDFPLYLYATYMKGKEESMPTQAHRVLIRDEFPMK